MLFAKAPAKVAEQIRKKLLAAGVFDPSHEVERSGQHIYFPVTKETKGFDFVERKAKPRVVKPRSLREALVGKMPEKDLESLVTSFDTIGDIAVIEIRNNLNEKMIGEAVLASNPSLKVVCKKVGGHEGPFRIMPVEVIAGEPRTIATYKEHGIQMRVDVNGVYFSPRLGTERLRIAELVHPGETIAGFFAGVGPFPLVIAKQKHCTVYAVELNPRGYELMRENVKLNKLKGEVIPLLGDVREIAQTLPKCDRVLMPLPKGGEDFLEAAFLVAKPNATVHFYQFAPDEDPFTDAVRKIEAAAAKAKRRIRITGTRIVRPHAVRTSQVAIDFTVS